MSGNVRKKRVPKIAICVRCSRKIKINARGRCSACYNYWLRNGGEERPVRLYNIRDRFCMDCKEEEIFSMDRCRTCYNYWLSYDKKKTRPIHLRNRNKMDCKNLHCKKPLRLDIEPVKGRCKQCNEYWRRHKKDRPAKFARFTPPYGYTTCDNPNCDKPLSRKGTCGDCVAWEKLYGEDRPREFCPIRVMLGWCECGNVAEIKYDVTVTKTIYESILCPSCYEIELAFRP